MLIVQTLESLDSFHDFPDPQEVQEGQDNHNGHYQGSNNTGEANKLPAESTAQTYAGLLPFKATKSISFL